MFLFIRPIHIAKSLTAKTGHVSIQTRKARRNRRPMGTSIPGADGDHVLLRGNLAESAGRDQTKLSDPASAKP